MDLPKGLLELLQGRIVDDEHEKIISQVSELTHSRLNALAGDNLLARKYLQTIWKQIVQGMDKAKLSSEEPEVLQVMRIVIETYELRNKLHAELHAKREAEALLKKTEVDKDT